MSVRLVSTRVVAALVVVGTVAPTAIAASPAVVADPVVVDGDAWIAYQAQSHGRYGVHLIRPDGTDAHFPLLMMPGGEQLHPDWSPDGDHLVLDVADSGGTPDLWIADVQGWATREVVSCDAPCLWVQEPDWSPDGRSIAFQRHVQSDTGEVSTVEILDLETGETRVVYETGPEVGLFAPRWSPDGDSLVVEIPAFAQSGLTSAALGVLDLSLAEPEMHTLVPGDHFANNPDWSPLGDLITFSAPIEGGEAGGALSDIWVIRPDGSGLAQVTDVAATGGAAVHPTFTPDGQRILFKLSSSEFGGDDDMATVALDGSDLEWATTSGPTYGWHPRLRPTP